MQRQLVIPVAPNAPLWLDLGHVDGTAWPALNEVTLVTGLRFHVLYGFDEAAQQMRWSLQGQVWQFDPRALRSVVRSVTRLLSALNGIDQKCDAVYPGILWNAAEIPELIWIAVFECLDQTGVSTTSVVEWLPMAVLREYCVRSPS
jgi:hypothetical protein